MLIKYVSPKFFGKNEAKGGWIWGFSWGFCNRYIDTFCTMANIDVAKRREINGLSSMGQIHLDEHWCRVGWVLFLDPFLHLNLEKAFPNEFRIVPEIEIFCELNYKFVLSKMWGLELSKTHFCHFKQGFQFQAFFWTQEENPFRNWDRQPNLQNRSHPKLSSNRAYKSPYLCQTLLGDDID